MTDRALIMLTVLGGIGTLAVVQAAREDIKAPKGDWVPETPWRPATLTEDLLVFVLAQAAVAMVIAGTPELVNQARALVATAR